MLIGIALLLGGIAIGVLIGWIIYRDNLRERGRYVVGEGRMPSGWLHDGRLFFPQKDPKLDPDDWLAGLSEG